MDKTTKKAEVSMKKKQTTHDKAIRLIEGGHVNVDGHRVRMKKVSNIVDVCNLCEMDSICRIGSDMNKLCMECDFITQHDCYLELVTNDKRRMQ